MMINSVLIKELNIGWLVYLIKNADNELADWIDESDIEDTSLLDDASDTLRTVLDYSEDDYLDRIDNLIQLIKLSKRFYTCRELNAWEIKPCWNVYQQLKKQLDDINIELLNILSATELNTRFKEIQKLIKQTKNEIDVAREDLELSESLDEWLVDFSEYLTRLGNLKFNKLDSEVSELYNLFNTVANYCKCQRFSVKEQCLQELSNLYKASKDLES